MIRISPVGRIWFGGTAVVVAAAVVLQAVLSADGQPYSVFDTAGERLANLLAYFTILSNVLVGLTFGILAVRAEASSRLLRVLHLDAVLGITVTGIVYNLVLAPLDDPTGAAWLANLLLHMVVPAMAVLGWLLFGPRGAVDTPTVLLSTIYPLAWLAFTLTRGALVDWSPFPAWYPYPFVDVGALGYARVALNCVVIAVLFLGLAFGARALDRFLVRRFHPDAVAAVRPRGRAVVTAATAPEAATATTDGRPALRVGVQLQPQHADYGRIRDAVAEAEEAGVDIVFNWDHFFPLRGAADGKHFECWTMLGAWAEATSRVEIGALVTCNGYRNPELLADMARTVDHISGGRLILGIGAGWFRRDFDEYGYDFGTAGSRLAGLADALPRIRSRWERLNPPPTRDIPILVGGGGEKKTLRCTAEYADIWHGFGDAETIAHKSRVLDAHCADVGRDPRSIVRSAGVQAAPDAVADDLLAAGVGLFTIGVGGPRYDLGLLKDWIAWRDERRG
ncbi:hypothetical protein PSD17_12620 [Pseudonocardia sp. D17]|nr:hypothetical protein PSD17_12620 [Pseudonocardia sp. D17]